MTIAVDLGRKATKPTNQPMEDESIAYYFNGGRILFEYIDYFDGVLFQV